MSSRRLIVQQKQPLTQALTQAQNRLDHAPGDDVKKCQTPLLNARYVADSKALEEARIEFASNQAVMLRDVFAPDAFARIKEEVDAAASIAIQRDFTMPEYETPRRMRVLGGPMVTRHLPFVRRLYSAPQVKTLLEEIVGQEVFLCEHPKEFAVVNYLHGRGETHGWHLDDPDFALVLAIEVPRHGGGAVELVPGFTPRQPPQAPELQRCVEAARTDGSLTTLRLDAGDAYVLHASCTLHRVTELEQEVDRRAVLNFAYCADKDQEYGATADLLF